MENNQQQPKHLWQVFEMLEQMEFRNGALKLEMTPLYLLLKEYCSTHFDDIIPEDYFKRFDFQAYLQSKKGEMHFQKRDLNESED